MIEDKAFRAARRPSYNFYLIRIQAASLIIGNAFLPAKNDRFSDMNYLSLRPVVLRMIKTIPRKNNTIHLIYQPIFLSRTVLASLRSIPSKRSPLAYF